MGDLSIKIKIADREYPMRVKPDDEEKIRKAGKLINEKIKSYKEKFGIDDKQDLLAMVSFDILIDKIETDRNMENSDENISNKINYLNNLISQSL
ncbi:MAG: cell division protein ZapA [Bacteroidetes bacterium]|nr:cell division protein ZapA [Bacteroidota bacterium]MCZ6899698.1 cell division protein ZapA [Bacteroidota bacterium]